MLIELARFLTHDAARNNVRIRQDFHDDIKTHDGRSRGCA